MKIYKDNVFKDIENSINLGLINLKKYDFPKTYLYTIGKIHIKSFDNDIIIQMDENVTGDYIKKWQSSIGKLFIHDLKNNNLDNYFVTLYNDNYYLIKLMDENDILYCKKKNIKDYQDIIINDNIYSVICISSSNNFILADNSKLNFYADESIKSNELDDTEINIDNDYESLELFDDEIFENDWDN